MTTIQSNMGINPAFTSNLKKSNNDDHSGVKVGTGVAVAATVPALASKATADKTIKFFVNNARKIVAEQNKTIADEEAKIADNFKTYGKKAATDLNKTHKEIIELAEQIKADQYKHASNLFKQRKIMKNINFKKAYLLALPVYIGAGAIIDYMNNKQRANSEPNAKTKNGNPYVKANMGKKLGFATGVLAEILLYSINKNAQNAVKKSGKSSLIAGMLLAGTGGYLLGALTDKISNKKARKEADRIA